MSCLANSEKGGGRENESERERVNEKGSYICGYVKKQSKKTGKCGT